VGVNLLCLGILGEYVGRIYEESKNRPLFIVQQTAGKVAETPSRTSGLSEG